MASANGYSVRKQDIKTPEYVDTARNILCGDNWPLNDYFNSEPKPAWTPFRQPNSKAGTSEE